MLSTGVLQLHVWPGGDSLPVQHLPGGRVGQPDGGQFRTGPVQALKSEVIRGRAQPLA